MSSPRRPGSTSRRRVAGQRRSDSTANGSGPRIGLNQPEDSAEAVEESATEEQVETTTGVETGAESSEADTGAASPEAQGDEATGDKTASANASSADASADAESADGNVTAGADTTAPVESPTAAVSTGKAGRAKRNGTTHESTPAAPENDGGQPGYWYQSDSAPSAEAGASQYAGDDPTENGSAGTGSDPTAPAAAGRRGGTKNTIVAMLAATVLLVGLATWFGIEAYAARNGNQALVDQATTSEVNGQITDGVEKVFSYDFADTGKTERAAKDLLTGAAIGEYDQLFTTVKQQAPIQKLVVTTTVKASSVTRLESDRAEVLLFVDQNATRTDVGGPPSVGPAQVVINAEKHGDQWKISHITQH